MSLLLNSRTSHFKDHQNIISSIKQELKKANTNKNSEIFRANAIMEGFQKVGCDAINVGHYEVINGLSFLEQIVKKTDIPFISSNLSSTTFFKLSNSPKLKT